MQHLRERVIFYPLIGFILGLIVGAVMYGLSYLTTNSILIGTGGALVVLGLTRAGFLIDLALTGARLWDKKIPGSRAKFDSATQLGITGFASVYLTVFLGAILLSLIEVQDYLLVIALAFTSAAIAAVFGAFLGKPIGEMTSATPAKQSSLVRTGAVLALQLLVFLSAIIYFSRTELLASIAVAVFIAAAIPHLLSMRFSGVTPEIVGASMSLASLTSLAIFNWF